MTPAALSLLDRRLARIHKEHSSSLSDALSQALAVLDVSRRATILRAFDKFRCDSAAAQQTYGQLLCAEVVLVVQGIQQSLNSGGKSQILQVVAKYLNDDLYAHNFVKLEEAIGRHFGRAGMQIDLAPNRPDIARSLYDVGSKNFAISANAQIDDDLELVVQRQQAVFAHPKTEAKDDSTESKLEQANRLIRLEPNLFG